MGNYRYMCVKIEPQGDLFPMYTSNEITHMMTSVCTGKILPVIFVCITCATALHVQHLSVTSKDIYTGDILIMDP